jgi:hypothetical protein
MPPTRRRSRDAAEPAWATTAIVADDCCVAQEAMWIAEQLADPDDAGRTMAVSVTFPRGASPVAIAGALREVARAQPALRTRFRVRDGRLRRTVQDDAELDVDTARPGPDDPHGDTAVQRLARLPLDLIAAPTRFTVLPCPDGTLRLLAQAHHALVDGTSKDVLADLLLRAIATTPLPAAADFGAYVRGERVAIERLQAPARRYWTPVLERISGCVPPTESHERPAGSRGASVPLALPPGARDRVARAAQALGVSSFVVLLLTALLAEHEQQGWPRDGVTTTIPLGTRDGSTAATIGMFVNEVPVHLAARPTWSVRRGAAQLAAQVADVSALRAFPFPVALARFGPRVDPRSLRPAHGTSFRRSGWEPPAGVAVDRMLPVFGHGWAARLRFLQTPRALLGSLEYDVGLTSADRAQALRDRVADLVGGVEANVDARLGTWTR